jgi:hypothetical protein
MVVTRSYASKYNLKLNDGLDNTRKNNYENDDNYIFRFIYLLFYISLLILLFLTLVNYFFENKYNYLNELKLNKENNFILLENNIPEKTLEYLSIGLYDRLPSKSYEKNYNYFDNLYNEFLYKLLTEDRYNYYMNFFN